MKPELQTLKNMSVYPISFVVTVVWQFDIASDKCLFFETRRTIEPQKC